jgi:hypothetical protein
MKCGRPGFLALLMLASTSGVMLPQQRPAPPSVYVSKGACPFECCRYGRWTSNRAVTLLDHPGGHPVANVQEGAQVLATLLSGYKLNRSNWLGRSVRSSSESDG